MLSNTVDNRDHPKLLVSPTADLTAASHTTSIEIYWNKATLASEQVKLLHDLKGVGVGTNGVEQFMIELENDDTIEFGKIIL